MSEYLDRIVGALKTIAEEERIALDRASDAVADAIDCVRSDRYHR